MNTTPRGVIPGPGTTMLLRAKVIEKSGQVRYSSLFNVSLDSSLSSQIRSVCLSNVQFSRVGLCVRVRVVIERGDVRAACGVSYRSVITQSCHADFDVTYDHESRRFVSPYDLCMDDGSPLVLHVPIRALKLRSGSCVVLHHVEHPESATSLAAAAATVAASPSDRSFSGLRVGSLVTQNLTGRSVSFLSRPTVQGICHCLPCLVLSCLVLFCVRFGLLFYFFCLYWFVTDSIFFGLRVVSRSISSSFFFSFSYNFPRCQQPRSVLSCGQKLVPHSMLH